ncbi:MAG TPA: DUF1684 domain-containing protein [Balneolaceae bacterium]|nr:DUF1684 domain-containing protein [Balneolaceae bacterium]
MKKSITYFISVILVFSFFLSCNNQKAETDEEYIATINQWHQERVEALTQEDSWLSLAGLYRLHEGIQSLGADSSKDIVFPPKAPASLGTIIFQDSTFTLNVQPDATVTHNGARVGELVMQSDHQGEPTIVKHGSFLWYIIERRGNYYIRLKDTHHPNITSFTGIERYPVSKNWRIKAEFKPFEEPKLISIPDVMGEVFQDTLFGILEFQIEDETFTLAPIGNPEKDDEFFIIFGDQTNGESTYGGGRYLYADIPDKNGITFIDFNKAYNPPCAFTKFATCPLPPAQNRLPVKVTAGEKMYGK